MELKVEQGAQSKVSMLIDHETHQPVLKKLYTSTRDFLNEVSALSCTHFSKHPLLVYPVCADPMKAVIVLEWGGDSDLTRWDLFKDERNVYSYNDIVNIAAQIVAAVAASHRRTILHGDIKPENFVIDTEHKTIKLIDFGLSARLGDYRVMSQGTPQTMAPEIAFIDFFDEGKRPGHKSLKPHGELPQTIREAMDWWSVGVTIHYIFAKFYEDMATLSRRKMTRTEGRGDNDDESGIDSESEGDDHYFPYKLLWSDDQPDAPHREILDFRYRPIPNEFSPDLVELIDRLMAWEPSKRNFRGKDILSLIRLPLFRNVDWGHIDPYLQNI